MLNFKEWLFNEVDWKSDPSEYGYSDVFKTELETNKLVDELNKQILRYETPSEQRKKFAREKKKEPKNMLLPQISRNILRKSSVPVIEDGEEKLRVTPESAKIFKELITEEPKKIFDEGEKSAHSNKLNPNTHTVNTGISALRAIVYDKSEGRFYSINTCKGAGSCIKNCYALKGFYIVVDGKNLKLLQRINLLLNDPERYFQKAYEEILTIAHQTISQEGKMLAIRWNDAGDWFSETYFNIASKITELLQKRKETVETEEGTLKSGFERKNKVIEYKDKVKSYFYTKQHKFIELGKKHGMVYNFSLEANPEEHEAYNDEQKRFSLPMSGELKYQNTKMSCIVPRTVTEEFFAKSKGKTIFKSGKNKKKLKDVVFQWAKQKRYLSDKEKDSIIFTNELVKLPEENELKYNVIVLPKGDSDISAQRRDVHWTFLIEH